ncbi:unnamed protein product [Macrosiphum euphorbiae]|uniref:Secreted protein n=1 Tax=Macrosiphum euphorbiae TaxID=13131 RepID=A0AAV0Y7W9_9HEMI|nr:unnamed protein product [Macrosiphum euphorbiae]
MRTSRRYLIVAVHNATVVHQHGVNLEGQELRDGQRDSDDRVVRYGPGVGQEQFAVGGGQQPAKSDYVRDRQPSDGTHARPPVIGYVVCCANATRACMRGRSSAYI